MLVKEWLTGKRDGKEGATLLRVYKRNRGSQRGYYLRVACLKGGCRSGSDGLRADCMDRAH
jgi:hypothetical protein